MNQQHTANQLAQYGRYGDEILLHVGADELRGIAALSPTGLTINPITGLPEAFSLKKKLTVDIDTTVVNLWGHPEGAEKGYNDRKRGNKSYQSLLAFQELDAPSTWAGLIRKAILFVPPTHQVGSHDCE